MIRDKSDQSNAAAAQTAASESGGTRTIRSARAERLAEELRANLKRRKASQRARQPGAGARGEAAAGGPSEGASAATEADRSAADATAVKDD